MWKIQIKKFKKKKKKQTNKLKQITNMQTSSPPKLDTPKKKKNLPISKTISTPPKQNKQDSHIHIPTFHLNPSLFVTY